MKELESILFILYKVISLLKNKQIKLLHYITSPHLTSPYAVGLPRDFRPVVYDN